MDLRKNYVAIFFANIINYFGDVLFDLFIVWKITEKSGNVMNAVYLIGSSILFRAILALFIGVLVDRKNKKKMIIFSNFSSSIIIFIFAVFYSFIIENIWIGLVFILINDINNEIFSRSYITISSELLSKEVFIKFQAKYTLVNRIITIAGSGIVGFLVTYLSEKVIFLIDILTFLICALAMSTIRYNFKKSDGTESNRHVKEVIKEIGFDIKYMFSVMFKTPFIVKFVIIMFILNMAYGYIPHILPVEIANGYSSAVLLGFIKSAMAIGEVIGLLIVTRFGQYVSRLFKISMIGNTVCMLLLTEIKQAYITLVIFMLYGVLDSITQPLFSYTVTRLDKADRGKILGGIDAIILMSPSIGMYVISRLMNFNIYVGYVSLAIIFGSVFLIVKFSRELSRITVKKED